MMPNELRLSMRAAEIGGIPLAPEGRSNFSNAEATI